MTNSQIAAVIESIADLLEFQQANPFRVRAYRRAAQSIRDLPEDVAQLAQSGAARLREIQGVGADLAEAILAILATGTTPLLEELQAAVPASALELMRIPGLGPKKAARLFTELKIESIPQLREACEAQQIRKLKGFGAKTEEQILSGIAQTEQMPLRMTWAQADKLVGELRLYLQAGPPIEKLEFAGSYRRGKETVGDLDLVAVTAHPAKLMDHLASFPGVEQVLARGETKLSVRLGVGVQIDLRIVARESFGAALQYFTGSKEHGVIVRGLAKQRGLKINEYGVYRVQDEQESYLVGREEAEVYAAVGLPWFPPELREARQEFQWAEAGELPNLVTLADIRGDLHAHTHATDGSASLEEMAQAAQAKGYRYLAITDHSQRVTMANGLDSRRLLEQWEVIDKLNATFNDFRLLKGIEVDILEKGGLDLPDNVLTQADWVVASVHYGQKQSRAEITRRIVDALANPVVSAIAHPTGRLINRRMPYEVDLHEIFATAQAHRKCLELNANPARLDLDDVACAAAKAHGIPIVISSDAHSTEGLDVMRYGILQARRGGLTAADVLNTRTWPEICQLLKRKLPA